MTEQQSKSESKTLSTGPSTGRASGAPVDPIGGERPAAERQVEQLGSSWPRPGDEGYVHPDGTPQSVAQLEGNRQAAADRAAAGSSVHGAPAATPGPQLPEVAAAAVERAEADTGRTEAERRAALTEHVREATPTGDQRDADASGKRATR